MQFATNTGLSDIDAFASFYGCLAAAAHVELQGLPRFVKWH
jgi:hypothetical protein